MNLAVKMQTYLASKGISRIFGIVGREASSILFNEIDSIEFVLTRHEFSAGVIAASIARFTRTPQVCFTTLGPGPTNLVTALATANLDRLPIIAIAAQLESPSIAYNEAHQCIDAVSILKPITKYAVELKDPNEVISVLERAFQVSMRYPWGPSFISIPIDMFSATVDDEPRTGSDISVEDSQYCQNESEKLDNIAKEIHDSSYPLIVAGDAVIKDPNGAASVKSLAEALNIPVITTYSAKGILPPEHRLNYGVINSYSDVILEYPVKQTLWGPPDLLFLIGYDLAEHHPFAWNVGEPKKIIALTPYESNLSTIVKPTPIYNVIGPLKGSIDYIKNTAIAPKQKNYDVSGIKRKIQDIRDDMHNYAEGLLPTQVLRVLEDHYGDFILANDIGMHRHVTALFFQPKYDLDYITSAGLSSFGTGLPLGIGAKISNPDRNVVVFSGDGGFHSNSGELETAVRLGLKITIIILNNNENGLIERYQLTGPQRLSNPIAVNYSHVNYAMLAEANGCQGINAKNIDELKLALCKADDYFGPTLIEIPVYYPNLYINPFSTSWRPT